MAWSTNRREGSGPQQTPFSASMRSMSMLTSPTGGSGLSGAAMAAMDDDGSPSDDVHADLLRVLALVEEERHLVAYDLYRDAVDRVEKAEVAAEAMAKAQAAGLFQRTLGRLVSVVSAASPLGPLSPAASSEETNSVPSVPPPPSLSDAPSSLSSGLHVDSDSHPPAPATVSEPDSALTAHHEHQNHKKKPQHEEPIHRRLFHRRGLTPDQASDVTKDKPSRRNSRMYRHSRSNSMSHVEDIFRHNNDTRTHRTQTADSKDSFIFSSSDNENSDQNDESTHSNSNSHALPPLLQNHSKPVLGTRQHSEPPAPNRDTPPAETRKLSRVITVSASASSEHNATLKFPPLPAKLLPSTHKIGGANKHDHHNQPDTSKTLFPFVKKATAAITSPSSSPHVHRKTLIDEERSRSMDDSNANKTPITYSRDAHLDATLKQRNTVEHLPGTSPTLSRKNTTDKSQQGFSTLDQDASQPNHDATNASGQPMSRPALGHFLLPKKKAWKPILHKRGSTCSSPGVLEHDCTSASASIVREVLPASPMRLSPAPAVPQAPPAPPAARTDPKPPPQAPIPVKPEGAPDKGDSHDNKQNSTNNDKLDTLTDAERRIQRKWRDMNQSIVQARLLLDGKKLEFAALERRAELFQNAKENLIEDDDWTFAQTLFGVTTHYRREEDFSLSVKIEGGLSGVPLFEQIAVLRECDLYHLWSPFCMESKKLATLGKLEVVGWFNCHVPMLGLSRDAAYHAVGCDTMREDGSILLVAEGLSGPAKPVDNSSHSESHAPWLGFPFLNLAREEHDDEEFQDSTTSTRSAKKAMGLNKAEGARGRKRGQKGLALFGGQRHTQSKGSSEVDDSQEQDEQSSAHRDRSHSPEDASGARAVSVSAGSSFSEISGVAIPPPPARFGSDRMIIRSFSAVIDIISADSAKTRIVFNVDPNLKYIPQSLIDFFIKKICGVILLRLQAAARKIITDPERNPHARRIRSDAEFYRDWLLPKFHAYCHELGWEMPPVAAFDIDESDVDSDEMGHHHHHHNQYHHHHRRRRRTRSNDRGHDDEDSTSSSESSVAPRFAPLQELRRRIDEGPEFLDPIKSQEAKAAIAERKIEATRKLVAKRLRATPLDAEKRRRYEELQRTKRRLEEERMAAAKLRKSKGVHINTREIASTISQDFDEGVDEVERRPFLSRNVLRKLIKKAKKLWRNPVLAIFGNIYIMFLVFVSEDPVKRYMNFDLHLYLGRYEPFFLICLYGAVHARFMYSIWTVVFDALEPHITSRDNNEPRRRSSLESATVSIFRYGRQYFQHSARILAVKFSSAAIVLASIVSLISKSIQNCQKQLVKSDSLAVVLLRDMSCLGRIESWEVDALEKAKWTLAYSGAFTAFFIIIGMVVLQPKRKTLSPRRPRPRSTHMTPEKKTEEREACNTLIQPTPDESDGKYLVNGEDKDDGRRLSSSQLLHRHRIRKLKSPFHTAAQDA